jgi:hypothetical protein
VEYDEIKKVKAILRELLSQVSHFNEIFPILICTFNNPTFLKSIIHQINHKNLGPIIVLDSNSTFPDMVCFLSNYELEGGLVLRFPTNVGPHFVFMSELLDVLPEKFILTDPDIQLSNDFNQEHLFDFESITESLKIGKVGCSLSLKDHMHFNQDKTFSGKSIFDWEKQFWKDQIIVGENILAFRAAIDTTFAFYNKKYFNPQEHSNAIRIDRIRNKDVSSRHLPWYTNTLVPVEEIAYYNQLTLGRGITSWGIA